jgi:SET domain-containing protein
MMIINFTGNVARFMNHSCEPNCQTEKWTVNGLTRIGLFALHDIETVSLSIIAQKNLKFTFFFFLQNTELTFNYNLECAGTKKKICHCNTKSCSGYIGLKKVTEHAANRLKKIKMIAPKKQRVRKPTGTKKAQKEVPETVEPQSIPTTSTAMDLDDSVKVEHVTGDLLKTINHITGETTEIDNKQQAPDNLK